MATRKMVTKLKSLYFIFILVATMACNNHKSVILLKAKEGEVKLEVDSVCMPSMVYFPILLRLTNFTNKKMVLILDSLPSEHMFYVKNLHLTTPHDTFNLGVKTYLKYLVFNERTTTTFLCEGYFQKEKRSFDSFNAIRTAFKNGKLEYDFDGKIPKYINQKELLLIADTLLTPYKLEASTSKALIVDRFLSGSFWSREEKLRMK